MHRHPKCKDAVGSVLTPGALEAYLAVRGARTMALRLERAQANAMILAERLSRHANVRLTR